MKDLTTSWSAWMPEPFVPTTSNTAAFEQAMDFIRRPQPTGTLVISAAVGNGATHLALVLRQEYIGLKPEATVWMQSYERAASDLERNIPLPSGLDLAVIDGWAPAVHRSGGQLLAEVHHRLARVPVPKPKARRGCWTYIVIGAVAYLTWPVLYEGVVDRLGRMGGKDAVVGQAEFDRFREEHLVVHDGTDSIIVIGPTGREAPSYFLRKGGRYRIDMGRGGTSSTRTADAPMYLDLDRDAFEAAQGAGDVTVTLRSQDILTLNIITRHKDISYREHENLVELAFMHDSLSSFMAHDTLTMSLPRHVWRAMLDGERAIGELLARQPATVMIGNQEWMATDLRVRIYANGDTIAVARSDADWSQHARQRTGCLRALPNGTVVYSGHAVFDGRGLAPAGFRLPTARELQSLVKDADGPTAQALAAYALGTADSTLLNSTNFGARQGGHVDGDGRMVHGACSCWWSSNVRRGKAKALCIGGCDAPADGSDRSFPMDAGLAVRCIKR